MLGIDGVSCMRILTYKRTHVGDPDSLGRFGINDCMGRIRGFQYDAVIGIGGVGHEPKIAGIDKRINWVGIDPKRIPNINADLEDIIQFGHFILLEGAGPPVQILAPNLARRMYGGCRYILSAYSNTEKAEAIAIIDWARTQRPLTSRLAEKNEFLHLTPPALPACKRCTQ